MLNKYPFWKYLLVITAVALGFLYATPNLYMPDHAIQISGENSEVKLDKDTVKLASSALDKATIAYFGETVDGNNLLIRLRDQEQQLLAQAVIQQALGDGYVVALNLAATTPDWLSAVGAGPMKLGLDLSGGVHFLLEVDTPAAVTKRLQSYMSELKSKLREEKVRGVISMEDNVITGKFRSDALRSQAISVIRDEFPQLQRKSFEENDVFWLHLWMGEQQIKQVEDYAVNQNLTTLRNRVNELGVAEPLVQKQGRNRIVVELPGVQDTAEAKRILGKTANLEFRLEAKLDESIASREEFVFRDKNDSRRTAWLEKKVVISGDRVVNAQSSFDPQTSRPQVNITLDGPGGKLMNRMTRHNVKRNLGVLFIERKTRTSYDTDADGKTVITKAKYDQKQMISLATIQSALGTQFRITGLDSVNEASELALLLRAGALAAPIDFVEERTVGPSMGAENVELGMQSVQIGMLLVVIFMVFYYRFYGLIADFALIMNLVILIALMSILSATLTLPGIAGIVLTVGMAVDANVLIFSRIKEELRHGMSPQAAIKAGYDRAFVTIMDANITTLLVAIILYGVGTGPVRGFAVTLCLGIVTSMFTAIMGTRALVNLIYGGRKIDGLNIRPIWQSK